MCECRYVHLCPSGHLPFRAPGPKNSKIFPPHALPKNQKIFTALPTPSSPLPTPFQPFPRLHTPSTRPAGTGLDGLHGVPGDHGSAITGRGVVTGDHGADREGREVWRGVEGVGRGSPCDGGRSGLGSRDSPGGCGEGVARGSPCDGVGFGLGFRDSPSPPLPGSSGGTCRVLGGRKM